MLCLKHWPFRPKSRLVVPSRKGLLPLPCAICSGFIICLLHLSSSIILSVFAFLIAHLIGFRLVVRPFPMPRGHRLWT